MTKLRVDFQSRQDWQVWAKDNAARIGPMREAILAAVRQTGLTEPITGHVRRPAEIRIELNKLRDSLTAQQLTARDRALLLEIQLYRAQTPGLQSPTARIFAPEALSRLAGIFRSRYPLFLGSEYMPDEELRRAWFPIPHVDLEEHDLPARHFDLVFSADDLAAAARPRKALRGLVRILKPGGLLVATVPFNPRAGETVSREAPEPGPAATPARRPAIATFSWDLLEWAQEAGLAWAKLAVHASAEHGIAASDSPGVFVLSGQKKGPAVKMPPPRRDNSMDHELRKLIGILSIPRSGTTMLTAAFSAAPDVAAVYEPFNADKSERWREGKMTLERLYQENRVQRDGRPFLVVKETSAKLEYIDVMRQLLADARPPVERALLVILRNPLHCFLSEVQGRREWWGEPDLKVSDELFGNWAERTVRGLRRILELLVETGGVCVSYSALVRRPQELASVFTALGLQVQGDENSFHQRMDTTKVRGDISLAKNPRPLSADSEDRRDGEVAALKEKIKGGWWLPAVEKIAAAIDALADEVVLPADSPRIAALRKLLEAPR